MERENKGKGRNIKEKEIIQKEIIGKERNGCKFNVNARGRSFFHKGHSVKAQ